MRIVHGLENEPEGGRRCSICIGHRLEVTARTAKAASIPVMATTLTVGPRKNSKQINRLGTEWAESYGIVFVEADFKKQDGFLKSVQISKSLGIYRQAYCGCCFSMPER
jgi:predicted adenine nucleotide alpha hydrolase (AANH) superfamily ATPase